MLKYVVLVSFLVAVATSQDSGSKERTGNSDDSSVNPLRKERMGNKWPLPNMKFMDKASELIDQKIQRMRDALKNQPDACNPLFLLKAKECANVPVVFSPRQFGQCLQDSANKASQPAQDQNNGSNGMNEQDSGMGPGKMMFELPLAALMRTGMCGDPQCAAECVMKRSNYIDAEGNINQAAITQSYVGNATESWKTIAADAVNECYKNSVNTPARYAPNAVPNSNCSDKPIRFMACVQRYLILNAPANDEVKSLTTPETCKYRRTQLQKCDPNYITQIGKGECPQLKNLHSKVARARSGLRQRFGETMKNLFNSRMNKKKSEPAPVVNA
ncbi:uncharacterized protein LOC135944360 [Cloeon dipterum]|uniref:uncharacterized protein LOC135944360 n=1 Tax=Cloeon dipterum TaxID=197152 RepID=UPI00321FA740